MIAEVLLICLSFDIISCLHVIDTGTVRQSGLPERADPIRQGILGSGHRLPETDGTDSPYPLEPFLPPNILLLTSERFLLTRITATP